MDEEMTTITAKEVVVSWDGEANTWPDYARKVRLQWEKTAPHKRRQLGPELASRLTGRAWAVTPALDHRLLNKKNGTKYLLGFLRDRLCRTAIPDAGARLEDLLIRMRRPLGMTMAQWSNEVLETYRKVQRALVRARLQLRTRHGAGHAVHRTGSLENSPKKTGSEPAAEPPSPMRRGTPTSATSVRRRGLHGEDDEGAGEDLQAGEEGYARIPQEDPDGRSHGDPADWQEPYYTEEEWRDWRKKKWKDEDESSSGEDLPWDELEVEDIQVLPDEVLGWLLLRRANLSAANRLAVQSSVQNSLFFKDIENALRDQEEELMLGDSQRHSHPRRRTYWVEEEGSWGLLMGPDDTLDESNLEVHWVGSQLPSDVYEPNESTQEDDEVYWSLEQDGWHGYAMDHSGYWLETDGYGTYWSMDDDPWETLSPEQTKELEEAYSVYEGKAKTFMQSRQFQKAKGASRGFYPVRMMKGKGKGKGKGKKGKSKGNFTTSPTASTTRPLFAAQGQHGGEDVMNVTSNQGGCFICGDRGHGWRNCPKRSDNPATSSSGSKGHRKGMFWVESLTPSNLSSIFMTDEQQDQEIVDEETKTIAEIYMMSGGPEDLVQDTSGYGVLDIGATETVTSLEALEKLIHLREQHQGDVQDIRVVAGGKKPFRFGNGEARTSESFILLKQHLGQKTVLLGMYTLNVAKVPILIGIKTLTKLGAIIDVKGQYMVLTSVNPEVKIPLKKSVSGHLLLDLTRNWLEECQPLSHRPQPVASGVYMVAAADDGRSVEQAEVTRSTVNVEVMSVPALCQLLQSSEAPMEVMMTTDENSQSFEHEEGEVERILEDSMVLTVNDGHLCNLAQADQDMRDRVVEALARGSNSPVISYGAQEEDGETTAGGDLRLQPSHRSTGVRSEVQRTTLPWPTRRRADGSWITQRPKQTCSVDQLQTLPLTSELRPGIRGTCIEQKGRAIANRRVQTDGTSQSSERQQHAQGQGRGSGCSRKVIARAVGDHSSTEERLARSSGQEGSEGGVEGQRPPGVPFHSDAEESTYSPDREAGDGSDSRSKSSTSGRDSRRSGVSRSSPRDQRRGELVQGGFTLPVVKEELSEGSHGPPGPHDTACTTSPQMTSGDFETENSQVDNIENDLSYYEMEEHETLNFESDEEAKYVKEMYKKSKVVMDSDDNQDHGLTFNAFDFGEQDARKLDPMDGAFILQVAEDHLQEIEDIFVELGLQRSHRPHSVMELCCEEESGITKAVEKNGGRGTRLGLFNGCDLLRKSGFNKAMSLLEEERPDALWVSLPCGPTSQIQELNKLTPESAAKIEKKVVKSRKMAGKAVTLMERQLALGGEVLQEWPKGNKAWQFRSIKNFWNRMYKENRHFEARVDGCMYGLTADGQLMKKPWIVKGTHRAVWQLHNVCNGEHVHVPCEGGTRTRMSAIYPMAMCKRVAYVVKQIHAHPGEVEEGQAFPVAVGEDPDFDPESLKMETDQTVMKWATDLLRLHKKLGHPSRQAFVKMLKDRGADKKLVTIASQMHCQDCLEAYVPPSRRVTTLEDATQLWEVIQMDNMEFTVGDNTYHFQMMIDEASNYAVGTFLFKHPVMEGRNATTEEVTEGLMTSWVQYFGYPQKIKLDKEGAHRGRELEQWALTRGVEVEAIPAEAHGQIGQVERLIGTLKEKVQRFLRSSDEDPAVAMSSMIAAHNMMSNVGGYSPMQWVFGRNFTEADRLHSGQDLPFWSNLTAEEKMKKSMEMREKAMASHRDFTLKKKIHQAENSRMPTPTIYHPGDIVYYKRYQPPAEKRERAHQQLDVPRRKVARWYGPARVLALETKNTYDGQVRQPRKIAWIIACGRLKRVTVGQLRFASERERLIAEVADPLTMPWTFTDLTWTINKGEFDEEVEDPILRSDAPGRKKPRKQRSASRGRGGQKKRGISEEGERSAPSQRRRDEPDSSPQQLETSSGGEDEMEDFPHASSPDYVPTTPEQEEPEPSTGKPIAKLPGSIEDSEMDIERLFDDPNYFPFSTPQQGPLFQHIPFRKARQRHEQLERPLHVQQELQQRLQPQPSNQPFLPAEEPELLVETQYVKDEINYSEMNVMEDLVYAVTIPIPENESEWRSIVKDPGKFVAKKVAKGVEVAWSKLSPLQREAMNEAKGIEIKEWISSKVCQAAVGRIPPSRLMRMRWVLVFKSTDDPTKMKAKARLVVLGYTDPDVGYVNTKSPTLSRRSRQLMLQLCTHSGWGWLKADAKAAFLQGPGSQQNRQIFGQPVEELRTALYSS